MRTRLAIALIAAAAAVAGTSCSGVSTAPIVPGSAVSISAPGGVVMYVAVGASETAGAGADVDRLRDAWPAVFYAHALPRAAVYTNLGIGGETTQAALADELPGARDLHPTLVTVWLNVDDLVAGVAPGEYGQQLTTLISGLRDGGRTKVLVANTPVLDGLPLVRACLGDRALFSQPPLQFAQNPQCPAILLAHGYTAADVRARVDAYNSTIAQVVASEGAVLVDLHAQGDTGVLHPDYIDEDGFHPNDRGHAAVAALFEVALKASGGV